MLARDARIQKRPLSQLLKEDQGIAPYLAKLTPAQLAVLDDPAKYRGASAQRTIAICDEWERRVAGIQA